MNVGFHPTTHSRKGREIPCLEVCPTGVIASEFAAGLTLPDKLPVAYPVAIKDDDNLRDV